MFNPKSWFRGRESQRDTEKHRETLRKIEKHFTRIAEVASSYARTVEEMSQSIDNFPDAVDDCVEELEDTDVVEDFNSVHAYIRSVNEFRHIVAKRMQRRTEDGLLVYKKKCAAMADKVSDAEAMSKMEKKELKNLEKLKARHPNLISTIKTAEEKFEKAKACSADSRKTLNRLMKAFERRKLMELKRATMGMISDEIWFHAHALELYTKAHEAIERSGGIVGWKQQNLDCNGYEVLSNDRSVGRKSCTS